MNSLSFLDLPGEIRNQIYLQLLVLPAISLPRKLGDGPIYPQILKTCHKVYEEAKQILYGRNTFLAHHNLLIDLPRLRLYYDAITSPTLITLIKRYHIRIRLDNDPNFISAKATEAFTSVEEFTIEVFQAQYGGSDYRTLKLFEGIRGVKKARVYGSTTAFPEYVEWLQNSMMAPVEKEVEVFDKEKILASQVGKYDLWTVSGNAL
jgi:hypothetical protein